MDPDKQMAPDQGQMAQVEAIRNSILAQQKPQPLTQEQLGYDCVDTCLWVWNGEQYEQFQSDYLNQVFPDKLNKKTVEPGISFVFHFLSGSLHYWVEMVKTQPQQKLNAQNNKIQLKEDPNQLSNSKQKQIVNSQNKKLNQSPQEQLISLKSVKFLQKLFEEDQSDNYLAYRRWGTKFMRSQEFYKMEENQNNWEPPKGQQVHSYKRGQDQFIIIKYQGDNKQFTPFKQRFQVIFLFYIDGVSFVFQEDQFWTYFVIFKKKQKKYTFTGVLSLFNFKISTVRQRHRISQVLIMPQFQKKGHGKQILDYIYKTSLQNPACFQITTQVPSYQYQCLRDYKQIQIILRQKLFDAAKMTQMKIKKDIQNNKQLLLTKQNVRLIKEKVKLPGHQIQRLANLLIYSLLITADYDMALSIFEQQLRQKIIINRSPFKTRKKMPQITFFGQSQKLKQFLVQKAKEELIINNDQVQQILTETLKGFRVVRSKLIKVGLLK